MPASVDWTIGAAPDPDEPAPAPRVAPPEPKPVRRMAWVIGLLAFSTLLFLVGYNVWNGDQVRQGVQQTIAREEAAGRSGDVPTLWTIGDPNDWTWRKALIALAVNHQAAPLPASVLRLMPDQADRITLTHLAQNEVRADVTRSYRAPDGAVLAFTLPQFYRYAQGQWIRLAPRVDWTDRLHREGAHFSMGYDPADAGIVESDLAPYLDGVLGRACAAWNCPPDTTIDIELGAGLLLPTAPDEPSPPGDEPLLFDFARSWDLTTYSSALILPAPHLAGYPADAAAAAWLKRAIAVQALAELATRLTAPNARTLSTNAFVYGLAARTAENLGLEPTLSVEPASPPLAGVPDALMGLAANVNAMWDMNLRKPDGQPVLGLYDSHGNFIEPNDPAAREVILRSALAVTNHVLRSQPAGAERKLWSALTSAHDQTSWLSQAWNISADEAWTRLQIAVWNSRLPASGPQFALVCSTGVALVSPSQSLPIFTNYHAYVEILPSYSPDERHLLVDESGNPIVIDLDMGAFTPVPWLIASTVGEFRGWLSDTVLATIQATSPLTVATSLYFVDINNPDNSRPGPANVLDYKLSPDRTKAAVLIAPEPGSGAPLTLAVMPAMGGPLTVVDDNIRPDAGPNLVAAWSPDSQSLAYLHLDLARESFSLRVADTASGQSRGLWSGQDPAAAGGVDGSIAWSPVGGQIAFALQANQSPDSNSPGESISWLGLVQADGSEPRLLHQQIGLYTKLAFSADGDYLAALYYSSRYESSGDGSLLMYSAFLGPPLQPLINVRDFTWAPAGHQLALVDSTGVRFLADVREPPGPTLTGDLCGNIVASPIPWPP